MIQAAKSLPLTRRHPSGRLTAARAAGIVALWFLCAVAVAQGRLERDGVVLYWGLMPGAVVSQKHALEEMHGGLPPGGGSVNHLVVALFDAKTGRRLDKAIVRAQLSEPGIVDEPAKYLPPMLMNEQITYGQLFGMVGTGPYRFKVIVELPEQKRSVEYSISASPAGPPVR